MFLLGWKLNDTRSPLAPTRARASCAIRWRVPRPPGCAPCGAWRIRRAGPDRAGAFQCVGSSSLVRGVTAAVACEKSMLREARFTSTKTHVAPARSTMLPVTKKLCAGTITSSPGPTPSISSATCIAAVAEVSVRTGRPPKRSESAFSKAATRGPVTIQRVRSVSATAAIIASSMVGRAKGRKSPLTSVPPGRRPR